MEKVEEKRGKCTDIALEKCMKISGKVRESTGNMREKAIKVREKFEKSIGKVQQEFEDRTTCILHYTTLKVREKYWKRVANVLGKHGKCAKESVEKVRGRKNSIEN